MLQSELHSNVKKNQWQPWFCNNIPDEDTTFSQIEARKDVEKVSSRETRVPLQVRPGSRFGSVSLSGGVLGRGTATHYEKAGVTPLASRIAVEIQEDALKQTDGEPKAIRKLLLLEVKNAMREFRRQLNAQLQTDGTGAIATVTAASTGTGGTVTVKTTPFYSQLLRPGQIVSVYDSTFTTNRGSFTILYITPATSVVTAVNDSTGVVPSGTTNTDVLVPEGLSGANPVWYYGIPYHMATAGTWLGLSRTTVPETKANNVSASSNALTTAPIRLLLRRIIQRVGKVNVKSLKAHTHGTQSSAYEELAIAVQKIEKGSGNEAIDMLFGDIKMAGVPVMEDIHAARDRIDFLNFDSWGRVESAPVDFLKKPDGSYFERPIDAATGSPVAAVLFWIIWFGQFFTDNPAAQGYISSLAILPGYEAF